MDCTGSPLWKPPPEQPPYSWVNFCVFLNDGGGQLTRAARFTCRLLAVRVGIVILFGVRVRVCNSPSTQVGSGREGKGLGIASIWTDYKNANIHWSASVV